MLAYVSYDSDVNSYVSRVWATLPSMRPDRIHKLVEQRTAIVGAWGGLWMVLYREYRQASVTQTLNRAIVEVYVGYRERGSPGNSLPLAFHGKSVVL